jgi:hypothetical protein
MDIQALIAASPELAAAISSAQAQVKTSRKEAAENAIQEIDIELACVTSLLAKKEGAIKALKLRKKGLSKERTSLASLLNPKTKGTKRKRGVDKSASIPKKRKTKVKVKAKAKTKTKAESIDTFSDSDME